MPTAKLTRNQLFTGICLTLALVTAALYWPMLHHDFISYYDDDTYITDNAHVNAGLTWSGVVWAFQIGYAAYWQPLTWLSHMLDCQLYGLNPWGHHLTNLLFHIANTLLLFLWLSRLTGALWRSAFVAALFAWHPLHVESVAWAAERKDVLSAFFFLLTLLAYGQYASCAKSQRSREIQTSNVEREKPRLTPHASPYYVLCLLWFACGLMSKPMVVTLPFVLLLLDFWPLRRFSGFTRQSGAPARPGDPDSSSETSSTQSTAWLICEKLPFLALALAGSVAMGLAQKGNTAVWPLTELPVSLRIANALVSYLRYISKTFWPVDLALIYPYPHHWPAGLVIGAAAALACWTGLFLWRARRNPYLITGWLWFLGTLVPAIGLVQVGPQAMADRFTYLPGIGLSILIVWGVNDLLTFRPQWRTQVLFICATALAACLVGTEIQLGYWQNSAKILVRTIDVTTDNYAAYNCLGNVLEKAGRKEDALRLYGEAVRVQPDFPLGQFNLGMLLLETGKTDEASNHLAIAAQLMPHNPDVQYDFGMFQLQHGWPEEAVRRFETALREKPDFPEARHALDQALAGSKKDAPAPSNRSTP